MRKLLVYFFVLVWPLFSQGCKKNESSACIETQRPDPISTSPLEERLKVPEEGIYAGSYIDFGETEDNVTIEAILEFDQMVGKKQAIVASSSYWGEQSFPGENLRKIRAYGAMPMIYWSPWDKPYMQSRKPDRFNLHSILSGKWDSYIDSWADQAKEFAHPFFVAWGLEMNGSWFPWSGYYYGGGQKIKMPDGSTSYLGPETYKKAYRYVVDRVRARGAKNVSWVFHINNFPHSYEKWNLMKEYYPGSDYADWIGMSVYGKQFDDGSAWVTWPDSMNYPYGELTALDASKPVMLVEWGIGEFPKHGSKAKWISAALESFKFKYPRIKAIIFWHERWENANGTFSNLRVNSSVESLEAYRKGISDPIYLDRPQYSSQKP